MARVIIGYSCCPLTAEAFAVQGHDVWTCDLLPSRGWRQHMQCDVWDAIEACGPWDFGVFHPMCTYLTCSAAWAFKDGPYHQKVKPGTLVGAARCAARDDALANFARLLALPFPVALENPATSFINKAIAPPSQIIHPHQFGDDASKATGLWLSPGVPHLIPTDHVPPRMVKGLPRWANQTDSGQNRLSPSDTRWLERSATYPGIAAAMGDQWGKWLTATLHPRNLSSSSIQ
jgi:hypothetical protein